MNFSSRWLSAGVVLLLLAGCNTADMVAKFTSPEEQAVAKGYFAALRDKRFDIIEKAADDSIAGPSLHATLEKMNALIPAGEPTGVTLIGAQRAMLVGGDETVNLSYEYTYAHAWMLTNLAVKKREGKVTITGMSVVPETASLVETSRFTLRGKALPQYLMLALAIGMVLFTLMVLVICVRTRLKGRKWPWILFILVGVGSLSINWTTGAMTFQPLFVNLFSGSAMSSGYGPWTIAISFPLGAAWFLARLQHLLAADAPAVTAPAALIAPATPQ